jgi:hypothetical protein
MKEWAGKNFISGIAKLFDAARLGLILQDLYMALGIFHLASMDTRSYEIRGHLEVNSCCLLCPDSSGVRGRDRWPLD